MSTLLPWQAYAASARSTSPGAIRCCYRWMARRWGWGGGDTGRDERQNKRLQRHPMPNGENKKDRRGQTDGEERERVGHRGTDGGIQLRGHFSLESQTETRWQKRRHSGMTEHFLAGRDGGRGMARDGPIGDHGGDEKTWMHE